MISFSDPLPLPQSQPCNLLFHYFWIICFSAYVSEDITYGLPPYGLVAGSAWHGQWQTQCHWQLFWYFPLLSSWFEGRSKWLWKLPSDVMLPSKCLLRYPSSISSECLIGFQRSLDWQLNGAHHGQFLHKFSLPLRAVSWIQRGCFCLPFFVRCRGYCCLFKDGKKKKPGWPLHP